MLAGLVFSVFAATSLASSGLAGQPAPDFALKSSAGENLRLSEYRGDVVMINFWATWCGPCRQEMPLLDELYSRYQRVGFNLLGVNIDDDSRRAMKMIDELGVNFPVLFDATKEVSNLYQVDAMPVTVIVDREGNVRHVHQGYKPGYEEKYLTRFARCCASDPARTWQEQIAVTREATDESDGESLALAFASAGDGAGEPVSPDAEARAQCFDGRRRRRCGVTRQFRSLDEDVQSLKKEVLDLNRDLFLLEEELLFPANSQVAFFISMDVGEYFELDSVNLKIDGKEVANYLYTEREAGCAGSRWRAPRAHGQPESRRS